MKYKVSVKFHRDFMEFRGGEIVVGLKSEPKKGDANRELVRKIADYFGVPDSSVRIVAGATSRKKVIEIAD